METLIYKIIKDKKQYFDYCNKLENLLTAENQDNTAEDEIELLTLLIQKWDNEQNSFLHTDPVNLLKHLMEQNGIKAKDLVEILGVSKGLVSDILNYKKGLSKEIIRKLAEKFSVTQEAFNRPYKLKLPENTKLRSRNASIMNTKKEVV